MIKTVKDIKCENLGNPYTNPILQRLYEIEMDLKWNDSLAIEEQVKLEKEKSQIKLVKQ
ncbi:hypothetical protein [Clostridium sp.]|uniref:hypothetical protein n=1 Tax=Clostridium sp. TaxID=1506 RepID=UPI00260DD05A|nr:hypothetical protein [Clostridium sp.]